LPAVSNFDAHPLLCDGVDPDLQIGYNPGKGPWREDDLNPGEVARIAIEVASEKQAEDIIMLDIRQLTDFADYFVIMSAESRRQLEALREDIVKALKDSGVSLHHSEGTAQAGWILLDYSDVIIHLFGTEERAYYRLDQLWSGAAQVVRIL